MFDSGILSEMGHGSGWGGRVVVVVGLVWIKYKSNGGVGLG